MRSMLTQCNINPQETACKVVKVLACSIPEWVLHHANAVSILQYPQDTACKLLIAFARSNIHLQDAACKVLHAFTCCNICRMLHAKCLVHSQGAMFILGMLHAKWCT